MKIARVEIEGFRRFREPMVFDLRDSIGRILDLAVLIGPNGCGKTTIMDAIALAIQPSYQLPCVRPDVALGVRAIVSRGCLRTRVTLDIEFSKEELDEANELIEIAQKPWGRPESTQLRLTWQYPDDRSASGVGYTTYEPYTGRALLSTRKLIMELLATRIVTADRFERCGGVFTYNQQRSGTKTTIPVEIARLLRPNQQFDAVEPFVTNNTREILTDLGIKSKLVSRAVEQSRFGQIQSELKRLCPPLKMDVVLNESEQPVVEFSDGTATFDYFGLSSGQQAVLAYVVELVDKRVHHSVVMIDEVELHQEEIMQRKLLHALQNLGRDNQLILSTHSSYLAQIVAHDSLIKLGYAQSDEIPLKDASNA